MKLKIYIRLTIPPWISKCSLQGKWYTLKVDLTLRYSWTQCLFNCILFTLKATNDLIVVGNLNMFIIVCEWERHWKIWLSTYKVFFGVFFFKSHIASPFLPQTSYFFLWYLLFDVLFTEMHFSRFLLHGENKMWYYTLLDLKGTQHNSVLHILLRLYSYYYVEGPIYNIQVLGEARPKLLEFKIFEKRGGKLTAIEYFKSLP